MRDKCWIYYGPITKKGYGRYGRKIAHRVMYELVNGSIPEGYDVHHTCETKSCVNPNHLELLTKSEHTKRHQSAKVPITHCKHGHEFTPENTYYAPSGHQRYCRKCMNKRSNEWQKKKRAQARADRR